MIKDSAKSETKVFNWFILVCVINLENAWSSGWSGCAVVIQCFEGLMVHTVYIMYTQ